MRRRRLGAVERRLERGRVHGSEESDRSLCSLLSLRERGRARVCHVRVFVCSVLLHRMCTFECVPQCMGSALLQIEEHSRRIRAETLRRRPLQLAAIRRVTKALQV